MLEDVQFLNSTNFWHPAKWKWIVVAGLLAFAFVLSGLPFKLFSFKPKLARRERLAPVWDGAYTKLVFKWQKNASNRYMFTSSIVNDPPTLSHSVPVDQFEVDLHSGEFILRQTDFFMADVIPLALFGLIIRGITNQVRLAWDQAILTTSRQAATENRTHFWISIWKMDERFISNEFLKEPDMRMLSTNMTKHHPLFMAHNIPGT